VLLVQDDTQDYTMIQVLNKTTEIKGEGVSGGLVVRALDFGSSGPGSIARPGCHVVSLGKTLSVSRLPTAFTLTIGSLSINDEIDDDDRMNNNVLNYKLQ